MNRYSRKLRSLLAATVLVGGATAGLTAVSATPASAASYVQSCFVYSNGARYTGQPVYLQASTSSGWVNIWKGTSDINGCVYVNLSGSYQNYTVKTVAQTRVGTSSYWIGQSPYIAYAGSARVSLGTGVVKNYWY